jgi:hypothetical protein
MKSIAAISEWLGAGRPEPTERRRPEPPDDRLRALPGEETHLFVKIIDNTKIVRLADRKDWLQSLSVTGAALVGSLMACLLAVPSVYGLLAGRQVEYLRSEREQLQNQLIELKVKQARRLNPQNVEEWAAGSHFVPPTADREMWSLPSKEAEASLRPMQPKDAAH